MGLTISSLFGQVFGKKPVRILMVGLDGAGKTTILNKLCDKVVTTIPTIGFNVERVDYGNISFTVWDMGGQDIVRPLWRHYYEGVQAIIFVVDSSDRERIFQVFKEYDEILKEEELRDAIVLVFANKQDLPNAMPPKYLTSVLSPWSCYSRRKWHLQSGCATQGHGLYEGLSWLSSNVS